MSWEGVTSLSAESAFFHDALVSPSLPPDRRRLPPGRAEAGVDKSSSVSESIFLKLVDLDLLRRGSWERMRLLSAMGEREWSLRPEDGDGGGKGSSSPTGRPGAG